MLVFWAVMLSGFAGRYQYSGDRDGDEDSTFL
jgi:hypothetical protein